MQKQINEGDEKSQYLEDSLNKIKVDNVKLLTDMKFMRNEH